MFNVAIAPVVLDGAHVRLEPLQPAHVQALWPHANDPEIWRYMPYGEINTPERLQWLIDDLLARQARGTDLAFAQVDPITNSAVGMTRFMTIEPANKSLEIGGTWLGAAYRRTRMNTAAKLLLLQYAFETLGAIRVQLRTDLRNTRSQQAIERIGAVKEGVLRNQIIMPDGYLRSSVFYSILDNEWPTVKQHLRMLLS
jgi:RimJ/RimL family protein N-acetyltransferase